MGSYEDASREHEQSCGVDDTRPVSYSNVHAISGDSMGDVQDDELLVMIQPEQHMGEHESAKEEDMHSMHDSPFEGQMEVHIESVMDVQLLGVSH